MGLLENCEMYFKTRDLYEVLNVNKKALNKELKKGYHKMSLAIHPDRVGEADKAQATQKFQTMAQVYFILSDAEKRAVYDETGMVEDEDSLSSGDRDWTDYWRQLFPKVTIQDIVGYLDKYRGSQEEEEDLKKNYVQFKGNPNHIYDSTIGYRWEDEPRYQEIIQRLIDAQEVEEYKCYTREPKSKAQARKKKHESEAKEAEEAQKGEDSLMKAIALRQQKRQQDMPSFFSHLEQKYGQQPSKKKSRKK